MLISILASGSEGNSTYININNKNILIDFGMSTKYVTEKLSEINVKPTDINYIIITHTHADHIDGLKVFLKKYNPFLIITKIMKKQMENLIDYEKVIYIEDYLDIEGVKITSIKTSHDVPDSRGYLIEFNEKSLVYITDTGYLNQKYFNLLKNKNIYIFEANHDTEMLINGKYPEYLKMRVNGDEGHLSNNMAGLYLSKLIGNNTETIVLAHLSKENNTELLATSTIISVLKEYDLNIPRLFCARQREKSELIEI